MVKEPASKSARPDRALVIVLAVIAALILVALAAILLRGGPPEELDPSSPEGVVQQYSTAVIAGDATTATQLLSDRLSTGCDSLSPFPMNYLRVTLLQTNERDEVASVSILLRDSHGGGLFGSNDTESRGMFQLVKESGVWKIDKAPYELAICDWWNQ